VKHGAVSHSGIASRAFWMSTSLACSAGSASGIPRSLLRCHERVASLFHESVISGAGYAVCPPGWRQELRLAEKMSMTPIPSSIHCGEG